MDGQRTVKFIVRSRTPAHTRVEVYAGPTGCTLGLTGGLCFANDEWDAVEEILRNAGETPFGRVEIDRTALAQPVDRIPPPEQWEPEPATA